MRWDRVTRLVAALVQGNELGSRKCYSGERASFGFVSVPVVSALSQAGRGWRLPVVLAAAGVAVSAAGCGEKSEPAIHPPTTAVTTTAPPAPTTTAPPTTTAAPATTNPTTQAPTAPVPKTTP